MLAVIFRAKIKQIDSAYADTAERMRELARSKYGCLEFTVITEGDNEIAISYWEDMAQVLAWKNDEEHLVAQKHGREVWYRFYKVQVAEVLREYEHP